ncbi:hypothetical protein [Streptacidiphilus sp. MAP5-3]|uniref:hypothetical protein n=1 Tax=unclassified Streptacidiphilus TaxID=2643834 RepID=UPI0035112750
MALYIAAGQQTTPGNFIYLTVVCALLAAMTFFIARGTRSRSTDPALSPGGQQIQRVSSTILTVAAWILTGLAALCLVAGIVMAATS